jgi:hypothetical protein
VYTRGPGSLPDASEKRLAELAAGATANAFLAEMRRFLPAKRVVQISETGLHHSVLAESGDLLRRAVMPVSNYEFKWRRLEPKAKVRPGLRATRVRSACVDTRAARKRTARLVEAVAAFRDALKERTREHEPSLEARQKRSGSGPNRRESGIARRLNRR